MSSDQTRAADTMWWGKEVRFSLESVNSAVLTALPLIPVTCTALERSDFLIP